MARQRTCDLCTANASRSYEFQRMDGDGDYYFWEIDLCEACFKMLVQLCTASGYVKRKSDWVRG